MYEVENGLDRRSDPALRHYLSCIGKYPLLEKDEEVALARRVRDADREALDALVNANLRFVVSVARRFMDRGLSLMDLIAEGNLGLITAARRFDERRDFRFVTYAVWWIRQSIQTALQNQTRTVRIPANRLRQTQGLTRAIRDIEQKKMGPAREEEVAEQVEIPSFLLARIRGAAAPKVVLDQPEDDSAQPLSEVLTDEKNATPFEKLSERSLARDLVAALAELTDRERFVVSSYFGLGTEPARSLDAIGQRLQLSRERVRQIRNKAFAKLREGNRGALLAQHLAS